MLAILWHYLENQFDAVTKGRRKRMLSILADTDGKLDAQSAVAAIVAVRADLLPAKTNFDAAYGNWKNAVAGWRAATKLVVNLLEQLQVTPPGGGRSKLDKWESKAADIFGPNHPNYVLLFPQGRVAFTEGSREQIATELKNLGPRFGVKAGELAAAAQEPGLTPEEADELMDQSEALTKVQADVVAFHTQFKAALSAQKLAEGPVKSLASACELRRVEAATALLRSVYQLGKHFIEPEVRGQVQDFYDLSLITDIGAADDADDAEPPGVPQNVAITTGAAGSGQLTLGADVVPTADGYRARRDGAIVGEGATLPLTLTFDPGEAVTLTLAAFNEAGDGDESAPVSGTAG